MKPKRVVLAFGGNAILPAGQEASFANQLSNVECSCGPLASLLREGHNLLLVHGNGPQIGNIMRQNEEGQSFTPAMPVDACCAKSQGLLGYMIERALRNELERRKVAAEVACVLTMVEVDLCDPAFAKPTKPIGAFFAEEEVQYLQVKKGWTMAEDSGRGFRRLIPSPQPQKIYGIGTVNTLLREGVVVIAGGGGGVPVTSVGERIEGVEVVIDKDRTAVMLADETQADVLVLLTDVSNVYLHFGTPEQQQLDQVSYEDAVRYYQEGHFAAGSMGPKMEALIDFAAHGREGIICSLANVEQALAGKAGTRVLAKAQVEA